MAAWRKSAARQKALVNGAASNQSAKRRSIGGGESLAKKLASAFSV